MICYVALVVLAVLSIFSSKYRPYFKESLNCVFRKATLRKCNTSFDKKVKIKITSKLMKFNKPLGSFVLKHFHLISTIFTIIFFLSLFISLFFFLQGVYFYVVFGNCNGPDSTEFCAFDLFASQACLSKPAFSYGSPSVENAHFIGSPSAKLVVIEYGCYVCPYTRLATEFLDDIVDEFNGEVSFAFKAFPLPNHKSSVETILAAECANDQGKYSEMVDVIFKNQDFCSSDGVIAIKDLASSIGLNMVEFNTCFDSGKYVSLAQDLEQDGLNVGICGTPTFFVGEQVLVSPSKSKLVDAINSELNK